MRIYSSKRDDILRERSEYRKQRQAAQDQYDAERDRYREARDAVTRPVKAAILTALSKFTSLHFTVSVEENWLHDNTLEVFVQCNRYSVGHEDSALSWDYRARIDRDGELLVETSSWSGMNATTPAHIQQLRETADALEVLMNIDWNYVLNTKLPDREEYIQSFPMPNKDSEFVSQLVDAELEELIGTRTGIHGKALYNTGYREGTSGYYIVTGETPSRYKAIFIPDYYIKDGTTEDIERLISYGPNQFKKENLVSAFYKNSPDSDQILDTREF